MLVIITMLLFNSLANQANAQCGGGSGSWCTPAPMNTPTVYPMGISNLTFGSINNSTGSSNYSDFSNLSTSMAAGTSQAVSIGLISSPYGQSVIVWVDWNNDGAFTGSGEQVFAYQNSTGGNVSTVTGTISCPAGTPAGAKKLRMASEYYGMGMQASPCSGYYSEFEDYTVIVATSGVNIAAVGITAPTTWAVGSNTITFKYQSVGATSITSANFGYSCSNGGTSSVTSVSTGTLATGQSNTYTFATPLSITAGTYLLKVWCVAPNGTQPDAQTCNDTLFQTICTGMAGAKTIDASAAASSTNYTSFGAAVTALTTCGVSGAVTFTVAAGTYNEQISIGTIVGISSVNTVTFDGVDTATRTISFNTGTTNGAVIQLNACKYITIKRLNIVNTTTTYNGNGYYGVQITNAAHHNYVIGCKISVGLYGAGAASYPFPLGISGTSYYSSSDNGSYNTVDGNRLIGGYYGVDIYGSSNVPFTSTNNTISNNSIENAYYTGIYVYYQANLTLDGNKIKMGTYYSNDYGIQIWYVSNCTVTRNDIKATYYGIQFYTYSYYNPTGTNTFANNMITSINNSSFFYGLYLYNCNNGKIYHNTIINSRPGGYAFYCTTSDPNNRVNNNIFIVTNNASYPMYVSNVSSSYFSSFDYNTIIKPASGTYFAYWAGVTYATKADLKFANPSFNQNNIDVPPVFVSATDLHLSSALEQPKGMLGLGVTVDIDGDPRCLFGPSIGADESKYAGIPPVAGFTVPDTIFINSSVLFLNGNLGTALLGHQWYLGGVAATTTLNYRHTFTSTGSYVIKLVTFSCSGKDSIEKTVVVYNPTQKPIADFIADQNVVEAYQQVNFTDLSEKGPTYWYWTFSPSIGVNFNNGTSNFSQNPIVSFNDPGVYEVCMWDSNSIGRSLTVCKTAYITVKATTQMCIFPFDTKASTGSIYDDGGPNGNYSLGATCNFLIDPCASSVTMKFTQFALAGSAYLRIYNGKNNLAPPLHSGIGFTGTVLPGGAAGITASSGQMYLEFAKGGTVAAGFAGSWTSVATVSAVPQGTIAGPDTVYDCGAYTNFSYAPSSPSFVKDGAYYKWYFDYANNNAFPDVEGNFWSQDWSYGSTGEYVIRLDILGCGGLETIYDTIYVDHPSTGPIVDFKASLLTATPSDVVLLSDLSKLDPVWWKWTITGPGTVSAEIGNSNTKNYGVKFSAPGTYTITLKDSNCVASNSLTKTSYITIIEYCLPTVVTFPINTDFSIERFKFGRTDTLIKGTVYGLDYINTNPGVGTVTYRDNTNKTTSYFVHGVTLANKAVEAVVGLGESFNFDVKRKSNFNEFNCKIWIDYNQDGTFQTSELVASSGKTTGMNYTGSIVIPLTAKDGYTRLRIGTNFGDQVNTACGPNSFGDYNDYRIKVTEDITAPVITITGNLDSVYVEVGRVFTDPGSNVTGATTITHSGLAYGSVITTYPSLGVHTITASDMANNVAIHNLYVRATADVTKPAISKIGADTIISEVGTAYTDLGATATDFYFGTLTSSIVATSTVNVNKIGTYTVTYNVNDAAGNAAPAVVRTIIIRDTQIPVITISGANPLYIDVFSTFNAPAATVLDNYNMGLTYTVSGGPVNIYALGSYQIYYNAVDSSGNVAATKTLTVIVQDKTAPQITLLPQDTVVLDCISVTVAPEPGYVITDNYYATSQITITKTGVVNPNVLGTYVIRYKVQDPSGNADSSKVRVYQVVDRVAPVITLKGLDIVNWPRWKAYVDAGTNIYDKCDPTAVVTKDESKVNIYLDGLYEVVFTSTDASGNKATPVKRMVNIYTSTGISTKGGDNLFSVYPNPNKGLLNVDLNIENAATANVMVFDANGKVVYSNTILNPSNNKMQIDLSNMAVGMYFIKVVTDNFSGSKTFSILK